MRGETRADVETTQVNGQDVTTYKLPKSVKQFVDAYGMKNLPEQLQNDLNSGKKVDIEKGIASLQDLTFNKNGAVGRIDDLYKRKEGIRDADKAAVEASIQLKDVVSDILKKLGGLESITKAISGLTAAINGKT